MCVCDIVVQVLHEEISLQWIFTMGNSHTKNMTMKNSWFFFEMMVSGCYQFNLTLFVCVLDQKYGSNFAPE